MKRIAPDALRYSVREMTWNKKPVSGVFRPGAKDPFVFVSGAPSVRAAEARRVSAGLNRELMRL